MPVRSRIVLALAAVTLLPGLLAGCGPANLPPDFADWPVDTAGYTVEQLPFQITGSFARGSDVYLAAPDGQIAVVHDDDLSEPLLRMAGPTPNPSVVHVTRTGTLLIAARYQPLWRSADAGATWQICLQAPSWRLTEDDQGALYLGNYIKTEGTIATLYKSTDDAATWQEIWHDPLNHHIHTVRWDDLSGRLYIAFGDSRWRGQAHSDDRGDTFTIEARGPHQGHTDVAFTTDYIFWGSDDQSGRLFRVSRQTGQSETLLAGSQFMWFTVAHAQQVYVGTVTSDPAGGERAALLASPDQGQTWQKLIETDPSAGGYDQGFGAESRHLTANGWLYCTSVATPSYRLRRTP